MKSSLIRFPRSKASAFTLVELLVVMGIIAILAATTLSIGGVVINAAKRAKAANTATQIQTACMGYYTEYSVYPVPSGTTGDYGIADTDQTGWKNLIVALSGNIDPSNPSAGPGGATSTVTNTRAIAFLSLKASDLSGDAPLNPLPPNTTQLYFNIAMDNDYDGILGTGSTTQPSPLSGLPNFTSARMGTDPTTDGSSTAGIAVWANCNGNATTKNPGFWVRTY